MRRVAVTGMGIVSSIGNDASEVLASLREGRSGITASPMFAELDFRSRVWGRPTLDPATVVDRRALRFMGGGVAWNHVAMEQAIVDSGLERSEISDERTGLIMGSGACSTSTMTDAIDVLRSRGSRRVNPFSVPKGMSSSPAGVLSTWFGIKGLNYSVSSACATSSHCIGNAAEAIRYGKQDVMFAGGCEELHWGLALLFESAGAMSSRYNDTPAVASRAYDAGRDGFVVAGGAGVLVLEEWERAKARGAVIHAELVGYGATSDGHDMVAPSGEGAVRCMRMALEGVDLPVGYVNPHATSTPAGDPPEIEAIRTVFGEDCPPISATKSLTGHSMGAAGVQEAIYAILMMKHRFVCESAHIKELDPAFEGMPIARRRIDDVEMAAVLSNSFGFGGTNASLVFAHPEARS